MGVAIVSGWVLINSQNHSENGFVETANETTTLLQASREAQCIVGGSLTQPPMCSVEEICVSGVTKTVNFGGGKQSKYVCLEEQNKLFCECIVPLKVTGTGRAHYQAHLLAGEDTNLNRDRQAWCDSVLAAMPYTNIKTVGAQNWTCRAGSMCSGWSSGDCPCVVSIQPNQSVPCLFDNEGHVRLGSREALLAQLEALQQKSKKDTEERNNILTIVGYVLIVVACVCNCGNLLYIAYFVYKGLGN